MFEQCCGVGRGEKRDDDARSAKALCGCVQNVHSQCFSLGRFRLPHAPPRRVPPHEGLHPELNLLRAKSDHTHRSAII